MLYKRRSGFARLFVWNKSHRILYIIKSMMPLLKIVICRIAYSDDWIVSKH